MPVSSDPPSDPKPAAGEGFDYADAPRVEAGTTYTPDVSAGPSSLPVPIGPLRSQLSLPRDEQPRQSFWRRIKMRRRAADDAGSSEQGSTRLAAIEQQLEQLDANLQSQLESLNTRLEEVWESEEQLSHLADIQEKLDRLAEQQFNLSLSVASLKSTLGWLAALVVVAAGAAIALKFFL